MHKYIYLIALIVFILPACREAVPEYIWVPGEDFEERLTVRAEQDTVRVGEALILHAQRENSGFVRVKTDIENEPACWWREEPPKFESEVAQNVTWYIEPDDEGKFNLGLRADGSRTVKFARPGTYTLRAETAAWCPPREKSNTLSVVVKSNKK
ncbi:MAG: hypothetical protein CL946_01395 [Ectothiorhodospiraceae bacterium]|nr:hypothetical protein [Ectothiorhodospiraceae bacterium]